MTTHGKKSRFSRAAVLLLILALLLCAEILRSNEAIGVTELSLTFRTLPESFEGFKVVQLSDLHGKEFGPDQRRLLDILSGLEPDIIVITGDIVDSTDSAGDIAAALELVSGAAELAPVYFVSGNHDHHSDYPMLRAQLRDAGAVVLDDESAAIYSGAGERIRLVGLSDQGFLYGKAYDNAIAEVSGTLSDFDGCGDFSILLAHRPDYCEAYFASGMELILCGHTHGGQIRLPFIGAVLVPSQGFFPKYSDGLYYPEDGSGSCMYICRGLGSTAIPIRFCNPPEVVCITLSAG